MKIFVSIIAVCVLGAAFLYYQNNNGVKSMAETNSSKILIAYFSRGGNTKSVAEKINAQIGGDMFRIETLEAYPTDYRETAYGVAKKQHEENIHPKLKDNGDVSAYDIIFVGTPAWWYEMAPAKTFLENNNFEGKTIVPFITHGGGGKYTIAEDMGKIAKGAKVLKPLAIYEGGNSQTDKEIAEWLKQIK